MVLCAAILISLVVVSNGCVYWDQYGLVDNIYQNSGPALVTSNQYFTQDTNDAAGQSIDIALTNTFDVFDNSAKVSKLKVCDVGYIETATGSNTPAACRGQTTVTGLSGTQNPPVIMADVLLSTSSQITKFRVSTYHVVRSAQLNSANNISGPSWCDLNIMEGLVNDCYGSSRQDIKIKEFVLVTWMAEYTGSAQHIFQAFLALDMNDKTYVGFLFEGLPTIGGTSNKQAVGKVLGNTNRLAEICDSTTITEIEKKSNCRCSKPGHYIFETTEASNGFCDSSGTPTCTSQTAAGVVNDGTLKNACLKPFVPQSSCSATLSCYRDSSNVDNVIFYVRDARADKLTFYNYTRFVTSHPSGFAQNYGENVTKLAGSLCASVDLVTPLATYANLVRTGSGIGSISCFEYDSATDKYSYAIRVWNSTQGEEIFADGQFFYVGSCYMQDLPSQINVSHIAQTIPATTISPREDRRLWMYVADRETRTGSVSLSPSVSIIPGRPVFVRVCFDRGATFIQNADPYGIYVKDCKFSNNAAFTSSGTNYVINSIGSNGCRSTTPGAIGDFKATFIADDASSTTKQMFCAVAGPLSIFKWIVPGPTVYVQCSVGFCRNTGLFTSSKCKDSCANTIVDSNTTDTPETRRKRAIGENGDEQVFFQFDVVDDDKDCVDDTMAKGVVGGLVSLLALGTLATVLLFCRFQKIKMN